MVIETCAADKIRSEGADGFGSARKRPNAHLAARFLSADTINTIER